MASQEICLLLRTIDNRHFFTDVDNFPQLIEFSKNQNAEVSVVKPQQAVEVMSLPQLAKSFCDQSYRPSEPKYVLIEKRIGQSSGKTSRQRLLAQAQEIRNYIEKQLLTGDIVSLQGLEEHFAEYALSEASYRKHITFVRLKLGKVGKRIDKVGIGSYQIQKD